ncbi:MAG: hypothetical protein U0V70_21610 [Terriglobia bacterium]
MFSEGFVAQSLRYELQEVVDTAPRSGIIVNTVDIRGLYTVGLDASTQFSAPSLAGFTNKMPIEGMFEQIPWTLGRLSQRAATLTRTKSPRRRTLESIGF